MDLNLVRLFVAIAESRNLSDAAQRSGVTRSNVSRRLALLERRLGAQLLRRTTRHMELTEAGRILYAHCLQALNTLESARLKIDRMHHRVGGELRVRIPTGLGHLHLKPLMLQFCAAHPDLKLRLIINDQVRDLVESKVDLAIHVTSAPLSDHVATRVCDIAWGLFATPGYLASLPQWPQHPQALKQTQLITPLSLGQRLEFSHPDRGGIEAIQHQPFIQSGDYPFLFQAAVAGLGIVLLPHYAVRDAVRQGQLVRVLADHTVHGAGDALYVVRAANRQPSAATLALMNLLVTTIRAIAPSWSDFDAPVGEGGIPAGGRAASAQPASAATIGEL